MKALEFKKVAETYKDMIYSGAYYMTGCHEDADDITQDILVKLWRDFEKIESHACKSWLLKSTRNACIDCLRKRKKMSLFSSEDCDTLAESPEATSGNEDSPDRHLLESERSLLLARLIQRLPDTLREIIVMHDIQGVPVKLVAETISAPVNTVKVYLHRGRKRLLKMMNPDIQYAIE